MKNWLPVAMIFSLLTGYHNAIAQTPVSPLPVDDEPQETKKLMKKVLSTAADATVIDNNKRPWMSLDTLLEVDSEESGPLCEGLLITPVVPLPRGSAQPACWVDQLSLLAAEPGDYRLTWPDGLPLELQNSYESVDITIRVTVEESTEEERGEGILPQLSAVILSDRSRRRKRDGTVCIRTYDEESGASLSGLGVRVIQRSLLAAEGTTDEHGRYCAGGQRHGRLVVTVEGDERHGKNIVALRAATDREDDLKIGLDALHPITCRTEDPAGFLRGSPATTFRFHPVGTINRLNDAEIISSIREPDDSGPTRPGHGEETDKVQFDIYPDDLMRMAGSPERPIISLTAPDDFVILLPVELESVDSACVARLPAPAAREYRLTLECPADRYIPPGSEIMLTNRANSVGRDYDAFRLLTLPENEISRNSSFPIRFVGEESPELHWLGTWVNGCGMGSVKFVPDETGHMKLNLGTCCASHEQAVEIESRLREQKSQASNQEESEAENKPDTDCMRHLWLTAAETDALRAELESGKGVTCEQIDEWSGLEEEAEEQAEVAAE
jgi:hypothetical protein